MRETATALTKHQSQSLLKAVAEQYQMEPAVFLDVIRKTILPSQKEPATNEQVAAFLSVAHEYSLNPFTREIYAFPRKEGGIQPIVSVDGWIKLVNRHPAFNGVDFSEHLSEGQLLAVSCTIYRKDRGHPTSVTEYLTECYRNTEPWRQMPNRMLRHKSFIQCARLAFGFAGLSDEDELEVPNVHIERAMPAMPRRLSETAQQPGVDAPPDESGTGTVTAQDIPFGIKRTDDDAGDPK